MFACPRRPILAALAVGIAAIGIACTLNPQPLPPDNGSEAPGGGGGDRTDASFSDAPQNPAPPVSDGGANGDSADNNHNDAGGAGDADAGDAATDAPSDAPEDG
jgi:hypothetical protein